MRCYDINISRIRLEDIFRNEMTVFLLRCHVVLLNETRVPRLVKPLLLSLKRKHLAMVSVI